MSKAPKSLARDERGLTPQQAAFVEQFLQTGNLGEAYARAYQSKVKEPAVKGRDVLRIPQVAHAVMEGRKMSLVAAVYKLDDAFAEAHHCYVESMLAGDRKTALQSVKLKAQLAGHLDVVKGGDKTLEDMTTDEIRRAAERIRGELRERAFDQARLIGSGSTAEGVVGAGEGNTPRLPH